MPKVVKLYEKDRQGLAHNQGGILSKLWGRPRATKERPISPGGLETCTTRANAAFAVGKIDAVELAKRIAACRAKFVAATGG